MSKAQNVLAGQLCTFWWWWHV